MYDSLVHGSLNLKVHRVVIYARIVYLIDNISKVPRLSKALGPTLSQLNAIAKAP
jgi:hypothetical protein